MGTHYLLDLYANPLAGAKINDVNVSTDGRTTVNGSFIVNVPPGVAVRDPADLADILAKKYQGLLVWYAGFTTLDYDDLLDATSIDLTDTDVEGRFGERSTIVINPGKRLTSGVVSLSSTPTQAVILWECFEYEDTDAKATRFIRTYHELDPDAVSDAEVSFDGGSNWTSVTEGSGGVVNVPVGAQGSNFIIRIENTSGDPVHIGSWAIIY